MKIFYINKCKDTLIINGKEGIRLVYYEYKKEERKRRKY